MRFRMIVPVTLLALSSAVVALPASAQQGGRAMNDGGFGSSQTGAAPSQTGVAQYNGTGQVVGTGNEASGSCAQRFHSFDPSTGTYVGRDGQRHTCQQ
jgi:hypothetical protein